MKRKLCIAGILLLLLFLLCFPGEALSASREGMKLWLNTLLPTLLPFLILTGFLIHTNIIEKIFKPLSGLSRKLFGLSPAGTYVLALGLLCGYPMGAKLASDLYVCKKISRREGEYLLTFCNNPSPAFLFTYLGQICLEGRTSSGQILAILLLSNVICMLFFRFLVYKNKTCSLKQQDSLKKETPITSPLGAIIDVSIMNGFETITKLGGYLLLFSLLSACISHYWPFSSASRAVFLGGLELTTGLHELYLAGLPYEQKFALAMAMTAFGGLCIHGQTASVLKGSLSLRPYLAAKFLNLVCTLLLVLVFSQII